MYIGLYTAPWTNLTYLKGVKSDRCTTIDGADVPWCPTELDENGEVLIDDNGKYSE